GFAAGQLLHRRPDDGNGHRPVRLGGQDDALFHHLVGDVVVGQMMEKGIVLSASAVGYGGIAEALFKMGLGNQVGFRMIADMSVDEMFEPAYGSLVLEIATGAPAGKLLGVTTHEYQFTACEIGRAHV